MLRFKTLALLFVAAAILPGCQARQGNDPIVTAVALNDAVKVKTYLAEGGNPAMETRDGDPLLYIATGPRGGVDVAGLLLKYGANPNAKSADGRTVLQNAASWCDVDMVSLLIDAGARVNLVGSEGDRPADVVCKSPQDRREAVMTILRAAGAIGG